MSFARALGWRVSSRKWHDKVTTELLFASYLEFAKLRGERRLLGRESLGRFLTSMGLEASRWRNGIVGEHFVDEVGVHGGSTRKAKLVRHPDRPPGYLLGDLAAARAGFVNATSLEITWEDGVAPDAGETE